MRDAQKSFDDDIRIIDAGKELPDLSKLLPLSPYIDEERIFRFGRRLQYIPIPSEAKHSAILSRDHDVTCLLIEWLHKKKGHVGREHVLSLLKENY